MEGQGNYPKGQPAYPIDYRQYPNYVNANFPNPRVENSRPQFAQTNGPFDLSINNDFNFHSDSIIDFRNLASGSQRVLGVNNDIVQNNSSFIHQAVKPVNQDFQTFQSCDKSLSDKSIFSEGYALELGEISRTNNALGKGRDGENIKFNQANNEQNQVKYVLSDKPIVNEQTKEPNDFMNVNDKNGSNHALTGEADYTEIDDQREDAEKSANNEIFPETNYTIKIEALDTAVQVKIENFDDREEDGDDINETYEDQESDSDTIVEESSDTEEETSKNKKKKIKKSQPKKNDNKAETPKKVTQKEWKCETCGKFMHTLRAYERHVNLHTGKFSCSICKKFCNSQSSLDIHGKVHQGFTGNEKCNVCDKTFYDKSSLNKHTLSVHMGIKNFQCPHCERSFYARKTLEEHVRVHTGERPFACETCPKTYKRISDLNHHKRLHKGETSHTCEVCGDGFRRTSELNRHKLKHANEVYEEGGPTISKHHQCEWCGVNFSTQTSLTHHIKSHFTNIPGLEASVPHKLLAPPTEKEQIVNQIVQDLSRSVSQTAGNDAQGRPFVLDPNMTMNEAFVRDAIYGIPKFGGPHMSSYQKDLKAIGVQLGVINNTSKTSYTNPVTSAQNSIDPGGLNFAKEHEDNIGTQSDVKNEPVNTNPDNADVVTEIEIKKEPIDYDEYEVVDNVDNVNTDSEYDEFEYSDDEKDENYESPTKVDYGSDTEIEDDYNMKENDAVETSPKKAAPKNKKVTKRKRKLIKSEQVDNEEDSDKKDEPVKKVRKRRSKNSGDKGANNNKKGNGIKRVKTPKEDEPSSYICEECGKVFGRKMCFKKHMNLHTGLYTCSLCMKFFASQQSLDTHVENHEGRKMKTATCNVCDKMFYDHSSLNKHTKNVHMNWKPFACTESDCELRFSEKKTLIEHIRTHTGERPFSCEECGRTFKRQSELNFHLKKHSGETKLTCTECGQGFIRQSELRNHIIIKHTGEKPFVCSYCGKRFMSNSVLKEHLLTHSSVKNFECEKCGKCFHSKPKLDKHLHIKTDCTGEPIIMINGVYICKYCNAEYDERKELLKHLNEAHEGENGIKIWTCSVCSKEFGRSQALKRHMKIHNQIRDYSCEQCGASFIQKHHLTQHIRTHTGEKPYQCNICLKSFAQNATLYSHMKHH